MANDDLEEKCITFQELGKLDGCAQQLFMEAIDLINEDSDEEHPPIRYDHHMFEPMEGGWRAWWLSRKEKRYIPTKITYNPVEGWIDEYDETELA